MNARNFRKSFAEPERKKACPPPITRATTSAFFISCWKCVRDCPFLICLERERGRGKDDATQDFPSVTPQWELERERESRTKQSSVCSPPPSRTNLHSSSVLSRTRNYDFASFAFHPPFFTHGPANLLFIIPVDKRVVIVSQAPAQFRAILLHLGVMQIPSPSSN